MTLAAGALVTPAGAHPPVVEREMPGAQARADTPCRAPLAFDLAQPAQRQRLAPGTRLSVWRAQHPDATPDEVRRARIAVIEVTPGAARVLPEAAGAPLLEDPARLAQRKGTLGLVNGDYFAEWGSDGALPWGAVIENGRAVYAPPGGSQVVAIGPNGVPRSTWVHVSATLRGARGKELASLAAVNDPLVSRGQWTVYTPDWRATRTPRARPTVVVRGGKITSVQSGRHRVRVPADGFVVTAPAGTSLAGFRVGAKVTLDMRVSASDGRKVAFASGHGGRSLKKGEVVAGCSRYENILRPRTSLAWNKEGRIWLIVVSTGLPDPPDGVRVGGATKEEVARVAQALGATEAVDLDGGGSTALYARAQGQVRRIDLPQNAWVRPIPVVWSVRTPTR